MIWRYWLGKFLLLVLFFSFSCALQTTFWFQLFGLLPAPLIWFNIILYVLLYRSSAIESLSIAYFLIFILMPFTSASLGVLWMTVFILWYLIKNISKHFFGEGLPYFMIASFLATSLFQVFRYIISQLVESIPTHPSWIWIFFETLMTPFVAPFVFWILQRVDQMWVSDIVVESGVQET